MTMSGVEERERIDGDEDTKETDVLELILDEVKKVRKTQEDQGERLEKIEERLDTMSLDLEVVRSTQESHGKELAEMKSQCGRRFETCSGAMKKLRDRQTGDGKDTGSWPAEAAE
jgi:TolA-binding protein